MSKITVTTENVDKFVKRFHKIAGKELGKTLSESQELFAKSLGTKNYHDLKNILDSETTNKINVSNNMKNHTETGQYLIKKIIEEESKEEFNENDIKHLVKRFYNRLTSILRANDSNIKLAYYKSSSLIFYSTYGDYFEYKFGIDHNIKNNIDDVYYTYSYYLKQKAKVDGLSIIDAQYLAFVFEMFSENIENKFFSKDLDQHLFNYIKDIFGEDKHEYILKYGEINNLKILNNEIYTEESIRINKDKFDKLMTQNNYETNINNKIYYQVPRYMIERFKGEYTNENNIWIKVLFKSNTNDFLYLKDKAI